MKTFNKYIKEINEIYRPNTLNFFENINFDNVKKDVRKLFPEIDIDNDNWILNISHHLMNASNVECNKKLIVNKVSLDFIKLFIDFFDMEDILCIKKGSEKFLEEYANYILKSKGKDKFKIFWSWIALYKNLSEDFMEKHQDKLNWMNISLEQNLSDEFIKKHKDKIDFNYLFINDNISDDFILNNIKLFIDEYIDEKSWRFINKEFANKWNKYKKLFGK